METRIYYSGGIGTGDKHSYTWTEYTDEDADGWRRRAVRMYSWAPRAMASRAVHVWEPDPRSTFGCVWHIVDTVWLEPRALGQGYSVAEVEQFVVARCITPEDSDSECSCPHTEDEHLMAADCECGRHYTR